MTKICKSNAKYLTRRTSLPELGKTIARLGVFSALSLILAATPVRATDGYFTHGVGAKAKGMAGAGSALPQDALAIATNPAAATDLDHRLDVGVDIFVPLRSARIAGNAAGADRSFSGNAANPFLIPEIGYVRPLSDRVSIGIAIYGNGGMNTDYKTSPFEYFGGQGRAGFNFKQAVATPTLAAELEDGHSIGVSAVAVLQSFRARKIAPFADFSADPANFTDKGTDWSAGAGFRVGYLGHWTDRLSVGAFYHSKVWTGKFKRYAGLFEGQGSFDVPASWGGGIAYRVSKRLHFAADAKRIEYSDVPAVGTTIAPLFKGIRFGERSGPGFGWKDITVYKFGLSFMPTGDWTIRAGFGHSGQPIPRSQTFLNVLAPGVVQDHFTVGATRTVRSRMEITGHLLFAPRNTVDGQNSIPASFGGGEMNVRLAEVSSGITVGFLF